MPTNETRIRDKVRSYFRRLRCDHTFSEPAEVLGEFGPEQPHPHPLAPRSVRVRMQPIARVSVCFKCGTCSAWLGYNEITVEN